MGEEISITRALTELKLLDKRISKSIAELDIVNLCIGKKPITGFTTNEEFNLKAESRFDSATALISRRQRIKSAIVKSNAITVVNIAGEEMTVAEAIERKTSIQFEKQLLERMRRGYEWALNEVERRNYDVQMRLERLLEANFGKDSKTKSDEMKSISDPFLEANEAKLIDPLKVKDRIEALTKKIEDFEAEVDFVLSESNALNKIVI